MRERELEGSGGLSAGEGGGMVRSGKHDDTSTGGDIEGLAPSASCISR